MDKLLGPYRLETRIGAGGMGEVFRATDTRLDRAVAIKLLNESYVDDAGRQRFAREARAASALNHPNICTVHDVGESDGQPYLVMELLEGETLQRRLERGPLPLADVLAIGADLADALEVAHAHGIVHRDIKPANVFITTRQQAKLMDFGIAKIVGAADAGAKTMTDANALTDAGAAVGTIGYMSPEQARGQVLDARTDIFSLGVTLYEMATGERPFAAGTAPLIFDAILNRDPAPVRTIRPELPASFESIIRDSLVKDRDRRLPTARVVRERLLAVDAQTDVRQDSHVSARPTRVMPRQRMVLAAVAALVLAAGVGVLWRWTQGSPTAAGVRSLAVLPLDASGVSESREALQGLAASVSDALADHKELTVITGARTASLATSREPLDAMARSLGADAVLRTRVAQSGDRRELEALLVAADGRQLWSNAYDWRRTELFDLQQTLIGDLVRQLSLGAVAAETAATAAPVQQVDPRAYGLYLQGRYHLGRWNESALDSAIGLLEQATTIDPAFGPAHALLGMSYGVKAFNYRNDPQLRAKGHSAIEKALGIDPQSPEAHYARGVLIWQPSEAWPHRAALNEFRQALARRPNLDEAWHHRGVILMHIGHLARADEFYEHAISLNPVNTLAQFRIAPLRNYQERYDDALTVLNRVPRETYPSQWGYHRGWSLITLGRLREAAQEVEAMLADNRTDQGGVLHATRALLRAKTGNRRGAEADVATAIEAGPGFGHFHHTALTIGEVYAQLGDLDRAYEWVEKAANDGFPNYSFFEVDPHLAPLRATERFRRYVADLRKEWESVSAEDDDPRK